MLNKPSAHDEYDNKPVVVPPFDMELDFTNEEALDTTIFGEVTRNTMEYLDQYAESYKQHPRLLVMLMKEIVKNIKHHGGGKGYIHIEVEHMPIIEKPVLHFVIGDFGDGMKKEGFDYKDFLKSGHPINKPGTHGIGGGMILAYATALQMDLVVYDNDNRRVMYGRHKGYDRKPADRRGGKGVHYVGTTILEEEPRNPQMTIKLHFPADMAERKFAWDELRNTTRARIEKEMGRSFAKDGEKIHYLMANFLGELRKNIQDHADGKGYFHMEKEYDPLLGQHIVHFIVGDKGPGIKKIAGSLENFFMDGYSTGNKQQSNFGRGGGFIKAAAEKLQMHLVLYDGGEQKYIVHDVLHEYDRNPGAHICDTSSGTHFIGSMILPKQEKLKPLEKGNENILREFSQELDFPVDGREQEDYMGTIINQFGTHLESYKLPAEKHHNILLTLLELLKNVNEHGGTKGYITLQIEKVADFDTPLLHFVIGDFGKGIKGTAGSYENFFQDGYSTGNAAYNDGAGGAFLKQFAGELRMDVVLHDNEENIVVNKPAIFNDYTREPKEKRRGKGAHFVITLPLSPEEVLFERDFDFSGDTDKSQGLGVLEIELFEMLIPYLQNETTKKVAKLLPKILNEGLKNIFDYGKGKGYIVLEQEIMPNDGGKRLHFAFGDYGPGIKKTIGSLEKFYERGSTTEGYGNGGGMIKSYTQECKMHFILIDNGERENINDTVSNDEWMPQGRDMSKGAHFIGTLLLEKKAE